jgi:uncharacterized membrane protein
MAVLCWHICCRNWSISENLSVSSRLSVVPILFTDVLTWSVLNYLSEITDTSVDLIHIPVMIETRIYLGFVCVCVCVCVCICGSDCRQEQCYKSNEACSTRLNAVPIVSVYLPEQSDSCLTIVTYHCDMFVPQEIQKQFRSMGIRSPIHLFP